MNTDTKEEVRRSMAQARMAIREKRDRDATWHLLMAVRWSLDSEAYGAVGAVEDQIRDLQAKLDDLLTRREVSDARGV